MLCKVPLPRPAVLSAVAPTCPPPPPQGEGGRAKVEAAEQRRRQADHSVASIQDPLAGSPWSRPETVAGFATSPPNATLMQVALRERARLGRVGRVLDIGCGAGRNAVPLASAGWNVIGVDLSLPMLESADMRAAHADLQQTTTFVLAPMDSLPVGSSSCDLVIAHGIWNLAESVETFRLAVRDAARVARPGAALFVFTFSRTTLPPNASPVEPPFVFNGFSGHRQCFLTGEQLRSELAAVGFAPDSEFGLRELNSPTQGTLRMGGPPVIWEGVFRRSEGLSTIARRAKVDPTVRWSEGRRAARQGRRSRRRLCER